MIKVGSQNEPVASSPLLRELNALYVGAGKPSARSIAKAVGDVSHTTVAEALTGKRVPRWPVLAKLIEHLGGDLATFQHLWADVEYRRQGKEVTKSTTSARDVFVIHGRDRVVRLAFFDFLRSLDLRPLEWDQVVRMHSDATPLAFSVIQRAITQAQAVVVLLTPDDPSQLNPEEDSLKAVRTPPAVGTPRPNVMFELGIALAMRPESTIIVEFDKIAPITDLAGLNVVRFDGSASALAKISSRLKMSGCEVNEQGSDWLDPTRFASLASISTDARK